MAPAAWNVLTTGNVVVFSKVRIASAHFGLLAINPRKITGDSAELMRRAASWRDRPAARPCSAKTESRMGLHFASPVTTAIGRLTKAAPGRSDSAARNAAESTSEVAAGESISAEYLVTGRHKPTESKVWCRDLRRSATATAPPKAAIGSPSEFAVARPVTRFDTPGPEVTSATPAFPVRRPMPPAI